MSGIRGNLPERKVAQVNAMVEKVRDGDVVCISKMEEMFDGSHVPAIQQGKLTVKEMWSNFRNSQAALIKDDKMSVDDLR